MPIDIRDTRVFVVGASGGIGGAVADAFVASQSA
jgi:NAD(P)-dependent dehydrogenase (short-subunit alcohol dehydrogenase family)